MHWAWFSVCGLLSVAFWSGIRNGEKNTETLQKLLLFGNEHHRDGCMFMHEIAPYDRANVSKVWAQHHNLEMLAWPACSPALNRVEKFWCIIVSGRYRHRKHYDSKKQLMNGILEQGVIIGQHKLVKPARSLPSPIAAALQVQGKDNKVPIKLRGPVWVPTCTILLRTWYNLKAGKFTDMWVRWEPITSNFSNFIQKICWSETSRTVEKLYWSNLFFDFFVKQVASYNFLAHYSIIKCSKVVFLDIAAIF